MGNCLGKKKLEDPNRDDTRPPTGERISLQQKNSVPIQARTVQGRNSSSIQRRNSRNPPRRRRPRGKKHGPTIPRDRPLSRVIIKKEEVVHAYRLMQCSYNVLNAATNKFSKKNLLGRGGFGDVYKGWMHVSTMTPAKPNDGLAIAVKRLRNKQRDGHEQWQNELNFLIKISHPNLVKLVGYCFECDHKILVYEYMPNGSLDTHLSQERDTTMLTWRRRIKIAVGAARGLVHLHSTAPRPVIHRDLKTSNILLDADFNPKLSDFGLAKYGPQGDETHVNTRVLGTKGYFAPEYIGTGRLTLKSDVYSFGVVLLEILSGSSAVDRFSNGVLGNLADHAKPYLNNKQQLPHVIDKRLGSNFSMEEAQEFAEIILRCLNPDAQCRPTMTEVLSSLEQLDQSRDCGKHRFSRPQYHSKFNFPN